jgi:polysaccharide export outer membrane protein
VTVVVKEIKSRMVSITGQVTKSGSYELKQGMTVLHLIAEAGGLLEYADEGNIVVMRKEPAASFKFNYKDVIKGKNVQQNIALKPGDIVIVP